MLQRQCSLHPPAPAPLEPRVGEVSNSEEFEALTNAVSKDFVRKLMNYAYPLDANFPFLVRDLHTSYTISDLCYLEGSQGLAAD